MPLILSTNRIVQPVGAVRINPRNPLTRGLVSLICPGCGLRDLVSGRVGASAGIRHALTSKGKSRSLDGTASTVIDMGGMPPNLPDLSGTYTLAAIVIPDGTSAVGPVIRLFDGTRNIQIGYIVNNGWMGMQSTVSNSSRAISVSSAYGKFHTFIGSHANGADLDTLVNGEILGKAGAAGPSLTNSGYFLGNPDITATTAKVLLVAIWNRFLTVEEKRLFNRNPWGLFGSHQVWVDCQQTAGGGVSADGSLASLSLSAPVGAATGMATAGGSLASLSLSAPVGAATGMVTAGGSLASLSLSAPVGAATGMVTAGGSLASLSLSAPVGAATGRATAGGSLASLSLSAPVGTATGVQTAGGSLASLSLSAPVGTATGVQTAGGSLASLSLSAPIGAATGRATAGGSLASLSISEPNGAAVWSAPASSDLKIDPRYMVSRQRRSYLVRAA